MYDRLGIGQDSQERRIDHQSGVVSSLIASQVIVAGPTQSVPKTG